ncbi:hypothetical protein [Mesorhizobium sp. B2-3-4]|uniref:hypothetical protein n=1 Tax=Mesorhizobium sp. B2-3-4 TaxID=2589959 RepID=UPI001FEE536D|nr:hypothetical protein [Mesorhizobium sp. B2-3-4]
MDEEYQKVREAIMQKHGIDPYHRYGEEQAAHFVDIDLSTLKRWRAQNLVPAIRLGPRKVRYLGIHVADMMLGRYPRPGTSAPGE